jgi:hypothetical protein
MTKLVKFKRPDPVVIVDNIRWLGVITLRQWNSQTSLRFRRCFYMGELYKQLYKEKTFRGMLGNLTINFLKKYRNPKFLPRGALLAAVAFCFKKDGITDNEIERTKALLDELDGKPDGRNGREDNTSSRNNPVGGGTIREVTVDEDGWELLIEREDFKMWRRPLEGHDYLCEYKCAGTYHDVSPAAFFVAQMDLEYRKEWDHNVIKLDVIDKDTDGSEVVHWITHFPYPMHPREYVYVRRAAVDEGRGTMALVSRAVDHPHHTPSDHVKVTLYSSRMVIRSHRDFKHHGFDYVLTYCDDPQSPIPTPCYKWLVKYGVPGFVDKVYCAAKALHEKEGEDGHGTGKEEERPPPLRLTRGTAQEYYRQAASTPSPPPSPGQSSQITMFF